MAPSGNVLQDGIQTGRIDEVSRVLKYEHDLKDFLKVMEAGEVAEIDLKMFCYFLGVLPPTGGNLSQNGESMKMRAAYSGEWTRKDGSVRRFSFAFAEGREPMTVFWQNAEERRFFAQRTNILNPRG